MTTIVDKKVDLIIHIGYPKCASTFLQNKVFETQAGFIGKSRIKKGSDNFAQRLRSIAPVLPNVFFNRSLLEKWVIDLKTSPEAEINNRLILSNESFVNRGLFNPYRIVSFLEELNAYWDIGDVKIILITRDPLTRIASSYAQSSSAKFRASQRDFDVFIQKEMKKNNLEAEKKMLLMLKKVLGSDKVIALKLEKMHTQNFWLRLKEFAYLDLTINDVYYEKSDNKLSIDDGTWMLKDFNPRDKARNVLNRSFGLLWPQFLFKTFRVRSYNLLFAVLVQLYSRIYKWSNFDHDEFIWLNPHNNQVE